MKLKQPHGTEAPAHPGQGVVRAGRAWRLGATGWRRARFPGRRVERAGATVEAGSTNRCSAVESVGPAGATAAVRIADLVSGCPSS